MTHQPPAGATPATETTQVQLDVGEKARVEFTPDRSGTEHKVPVVAVSRHSGSTYEIVADGTTRYGQAPIPPSEPNHLSQGFIPSLSFKDGLTVIIRNVGSQVRTYSVQIVGWEE